MSLTMTRAEYEEKFSRFDGATDLYAALSTAEFDNASLNAHHVSDMGASFVEYVDPLSVYARQQLTSVTVVLDGTFMRWKLMADDLDFGILGVEASGPAQYILIYQGSSTSAGDGTNKPLWIMSSGHLPFNGDGINPIRFKFSGFGVASGPNCGAVEDIDLTMAGQQILAERYE